MHYDYELTNEESKQANREVNLVYGEFWPALTFDMLIEDWARFVKDIEDGYDDFLMEYAHSIELGDFLSNVLEALPRTIIDKVRPAVDELDRRYIDRTQASELDIFGYRKDEGMAEAGEFWYRIPKNLTLWFMEELRSQGHDV